MNFLVNDTYNFVKGLLQDNIKKEEVSFVEGEESLVFHMHGLAGFYGPKIVLREKETSVVFSFKLFSMLENKINFQCDCKKHSLHMISEKDIPIEHKDISANITEEDIKEVVLIYSRLFKNVLDQRDEISSSFFRKAKVLEGELIFNKIYSDIKGESREYRVGIKDNNVYIDDIFNEGYFPVQSQFQDVFSNIYEEYMNRYPFEDVNWFVLRKEENFLKVDQLDVSQNLTHVKKFNKEEVVETCCSALERKLNRHLAKN